MRAAVASHPGSTLSGIPSGGRIAKFGVTTTRLVTRPVCGIGAPAVAFRTRGTTTVRADSDSSRIFGAGGLDSAVQPVEMRMNTALTADGTRDVLARLTEANQRIAAIYP